MPTISHQFDLEHLRTPAGMGVEHLNARLLGPSIGAGAPEQSDLLGTFAEVSAFSYPQTQTYPIGASRQQEPTP